MTYIYRTSMLFAFLCVLNLPSSFTQSGGPLPPAPTPYSATPAHMWELGLHGGTAISFGDISPVPNFAAGLHIRRAIDYVFSIRAEAMTGALKNEDSNDGSTESKFQSGAIQLLLSINNLNWNANRVRKSNLYAFIGGGLTHFDVKVNKAVNPDVRAASGLQTSGDIGFGIAFRLSSRFNLGLETKAIVLFGSNADLLDGVSRQNNDVISYSSLRLNFNIGNKDKQAEPLYWVNPMDVILQDITELKSRPSFDMTDTDGDGVIDLLDQDPNTPPGVAVDTRGMSLDSDGDGIPNHEDSDPYLPAGTKYANQGGREKGNPGNPGSTGNPGNFSNPGSYTTPEDVNKIVDKKLSEYRGVMGNAPGGGGVANWFLPMIHFNIDNSEIRYADYGSLASIAKVMKGNPNIAVVVTGFTDKTASTNYNLDLSYKRANAAIEHLVNVHGIARSRLILNYNGEDDPLVPSTGSSVMNRRVEFRVANANDVDMGKPTPVSEKNKKKGY